MITTNTYLHFQGNCEEAFNAYAKILGGKIGMTTRFSDAPPGMSSDPAFKDKIMHIRMTVGSFTLMGSDAPASRYSQPQGFSVNIGTDDPTEADRIFAGLAQGGRIDMPIQETFWAKRFGMCADRFGIPWMVNCEKAM
jgi:PhnB protein